MQVLEQYGLNLTQSIACGAFNLGISFVLSNGEINSTEIMPFLNMAGISAASDMAASLITNQLIPTLAGMSSFDAQTLRMYLGPITSGVIYGLATTSLFKYTDTREMFIKVLGQIGASSLATNFFSPLQYSNV